MTTTAGTNHAHAIRTYHVEEHAERLGWRQFRKWCIWLTSPQLPGSFVIENAWSKRRGIKEARRLWFEHVRFITEDEESTVVCWWTAAPGGW